MAKMLFLTGPTKVGKTTVLLEAIRPIQNRCAGYIGQRLLNNNGQIVGFIPACAKTINSVNKPQTTADKPFIHQTDGKWICDLSVFEQQTMPLLQLQAEDRLLVLDEIGGAELNSYKFIEKLDRLLTDKLPILGVYKSPANHQEMAAKVSLSPLEEKRVRLYHLLTENYGAEFFTVNENNLKEAKNKVLSFIKEQIK